MNRFPPIRWLVLAVALCTVARWLSAADTASDDVVDAVVALIGDKDKDLRAVGLEQVRQSTKGEAATKRFAAALAKLSPEAQAGLLDALGDRGDRAARPAVLEMLAAGDAAVRLAAIRALGPLGEAGDVPALAAKLTGRAEAEKSAAAASLVRLTGDGVNAAIAAQCKAAAAPLRVQLLGVLVVRRALEHLPLLLVAAADADAQVRAAALDGLAQIARPEELAPMVALLLKAPDDRARAAVDKAIVRVCGRIAEADKRADPLLAIYAALRDADKQILLPVLGRVGGPAVLKIVLAAMQDTDPQRRAVGLRALCNWPDGSVDGRILELAKTATDPAHRRMALAALIRVAPLPDKRSAVDRLRMLQAAMDLAAAEEDRKRILQRAEAIRSVETLRYVASFLDDPKLAQQACATIVELAHHRPLREPNKAEFDPLLDRVIAMSTDAVVVERAKRYKLGQTYKKSGS